MKPDNVHIDYIKSAFAGLATKEDLLELMNYVKPLVYGERAVPFKLKQLTFYIYNIERHEVNKEIKNPNEQIAAVPLVILNKSASKIFGGEAEISLDKRYNSFTVKKKSGLPRFIHAPEKGLKSIQKVISYILQCIFDPHNAAMGFVRGRSIVDNAVIHAKSNYVYNIDLKDFFPSVDQPRIWKCFQLPPFNLSKVNNVNSDLLPKFQREIFLSFLSQKNILELLSKCAKVPLVDLTNFYVKLYKCLEEFNILTTPITNNPDFFYAYNDVDKEILKEETELIFNNVFNRLKKLWEHGDFSELNSQMVLWLARLRKYGSLFKEAYGKNNFCSMLGFINLVDIGRENSSENVPNDKLAELFKPVNRLPLANLLTSICCARMEVERKNDKGDWSKVIKNVLPQGAPTSPIITNIICQRLDYLLTAVAKRFGLRYSRYADDITFSSMHNVYQKDSEFVKEIHRIISEQGFHIKESKTRLQKDGYRQEVTGLLVNEKANVQQRYIKQLRMWLYYWERYGYERASGYFIQQYLTDRVKVKQGSPSMENVIGGKLDYLKMVKGADNNLYLKLKSRFNLLVGYKNPMNQVLNIWETEGIENAMVIYYKDKFN